MYMGFLNSIEMHLPFSHVQRMQKMTVLFSYGPSTFTTNQNCPHIAEGAEQPTVRDLMGNRFLKAYKLTGLNASTLHNVIVYGVLLPETMVTHLICTLYM